MRLLRQLNSKAERYLPEQRLFLKTDSNTRYLRLTPFRQAFLIVITIVLFGWMIIASSLVMINTIGNTNLSDQEDLLQADYATRLNSMSDERDQRALEAQMAHERFYVALEQISEQQSLLLASEDRRKELETGIEVIQRTLRKTMKERDHAETQADKLLTELQATTGKMGTQAGETDEIATTLEYLNLALSKTVQERDDMITQTALMENKVDDLKHREKLQHERNQRIFSRLEEAVTVSISPLEKMFENVGMSTDKLLEDVKAGYSGMGGPLTPLAISTKGEPEDPTSYRANILLSEMDKVNMLRIAAERTPLVLPLKTSYRFTSGYGWRKHPTTGKKRMHEGIDLAARYGTPLLATADGVITFAGWSGGYGRVVKIRHALGFETRYAHMAKIRVKKGQRVSRGDRIGDMGSSGRSTGTHVHYEVRIGGKSVNPMKYIKAARNVF